MKNLIIIIGCLIYFDTLGQNPKNEFNGDTWLAPYTLALPKGWGYERILLPLDFAPKLKYKGIEDLRFTPDWQNSKSNEYWTYAYLWYLDEKPKINARIIERNLKLYYTGLVDRNIKKRNIRSDKIVPTIVSIKKLKTDNGELKTFTGTINMLDYLGQKPIILNCIVHFKFCKETQKAFMFYEISPKPLADNIWQSLDQLWITFNCAKNFETN